jgi:PhoH-like ATPase
MKYTALDTNIILLDAESAMAMENVVLSEVVLEEVDSKKSGLGEVAYQAREFGRILARTKVVEMKQTDRFHMTKLDNGVVIIANIEYGEEMRNNDKKIIKAAQLFEEYVGEKVLFMSNDILARHIGLVNGLEVGEFKVIEDDKFEFVKSMVIDDQEVFRTLHYKQIVSVDNAHKMENFSYKFECSVTGQVKLATIVNGAINVIGRDTETELRKQEVSPCNAEQLLMSKAIQDENVDIVIVEAPAGSGKTIIALSNAMRLLDTNRDKYDGIIYMRNTVDDYGEKDEEVGFLSGNVEKMAVYLGAIQDSLDFIVREKLKNSKLRNGELETAVTDKIDSLREKYNIQDMVALGTRGRTFTNSVIIIDEAQNIGSNTMKKLITRIGKNCKVIVIGSNRQIDSKYLTRYNNGLSILLGYCNNPKFQTEIGVFAINLVKTVRSQIALFAEQLFSDRKLEE